ncbi:MAG TPA: hypothetical protein VGK89_10770 [Candidatus Eisenbacteria bacterium]|jgi:hypothetical protein
MSGRRPLGRAIATPLALPILLGLGAGNASAAVRAPGPAYSIGAGLSRGAVRLGEPLVYRGWITGGRPGQVRFLAPDSGGAFTWGRLQTRVRQPSGRSASPDGSGRVRFADIDTVFVEARLQCFGLGNLSVPGLAFELDEGSAPRRGRLPVVGLTVAPVIAAADTSADLRGLRGPLGAPWWERVPWLRVLAALTLIAAVTSAVIALRRRRPAPVALPAPVRDPASVALAELEALKRLALPARGRFAEHAFQLGRIVRRFLEAVAGTPLPGDTTPEFVTHLEAAHLAHLDLESIGGLMRFWDRVKFARAEESVEEATRAERAVETLVRRLAPRPAGTAAAAGPAAPAPKRAA